MEEYAHKKKLFKPSDLLIITLIWTVFSVLTAIPVLFLRVLGIKIEEKDMLDIVIALFFGLCLGYILFLIWTAIFS